MIPDWQLCSPKTFSYVGAFWSFLTFLGHALSTKLGLTSPKNLGHMWEKQQTTTITFFSLFRLLFYPFDNLKHRQLQASESLPFVWAPWVFCLLPSDYAWDFFILSFLFTLTFMCGCVKMWEKENSLIQVCLSELL